MLLNEDELNTEVEVGESFFTEADLLAFLQAAGFLLSSWLFLLAGFFFLAAGFSS